MKTKQIADTRHYNVLAPSPFLICAYPHSGGAWLANFLTHGRVYCEHELCSHQQRRGGLEALDTVKMFASITPSDVHHWGMVDSQLAMMLPEIRATAPEARVVVLRRPEHEVLSAMKSFGYRDPAVT